MRVQKERALWPLSGFRSNGSDNLRNPFIHMLLLFLFSVKLLSRSGNITFRFHAGLLNFTEKQAMKKLLSTLTASVLLSTGFAQAPALFKDIWSGINSSNPYEITPWNGNFYFRAQDGSGTNLWKSDGTTTGTAILPSGGASSPYNFLPGQNYLFFVAGFWTSGYELYRTDGTAAGTMLLKDIEPGMNSSSPSNMLDVNGTLFFSATSSGSGNELWKSDGTAAGTVLVKDIRTGTASSSIGHVGSLGNLFLFTANDGVNGNALWKSDGTAAGTVLVKSFGVVFQSDIITSGGVAYFTVDVAGVGTELWKTDGTTAGTVMVKDIFVGANSSYPGNLTDMNGFLYFSASDGSIGSELWKTDGTAAGTVLVKDIAPGSTTSACHYFTNVNGTLFLVAYTPATGDELWKSDGTTGGTVLVKDIVPGTGHPFLGFIPQFKSCNNKLYFTADDGSTGRELWVSDGTTAGTVLTGEINAGTGNGNITYLTDFSGHLFFAAADAPLGNELWHLGTAVACAAPSIAGLTTNGAICSNQALALQSNVTGTGPITYTWTGNGTFSSNSVSNPTVTGASGSYTLVVSNACGTASSVVTASVSPVPSLSVTATSATVCSGDATTLTASGADTYTWTGGVINGLAFTPSVSAGYTVTGTNTANSCTNTAVSNIIVATCTGIHEMDILSNAQAYPNPSRGLFHIRASVGFSEVIIYNMLGEIIYRESAGIPDISIDLGNKPKGIYFYSLWNAGLMLSTGKIVIE